MIQIVKATTPEEYALGKVLFRKYADWIDVDLGFQHFEAELTRISLTYGPPRGCLLLAMVENEAAGCVAVRDLDYPICEMKRLYIDENFRGKGIGRTLVAAILNEARDLGYRTMRLDTLQSMTPARSLYSSFGFREIEAYYHNPLDDVVYMELDLIQSP